jgi:catechol 2,3-dioxygenase-like lactoylglutathione lyase family enzyme
MKRLHVHIGVEDLAGSIEFYTTLFGKKPTVEKSDYAKWLLDDPCVNFAVSTRCGNRIGVDHLGIQADSRDELTEITARLEVAGKGMVKQDKAVCCYVVSDKAWVADPQGTPWETFYSYADETVYGDDTIVSADVPCLVEERAENQSDASTCCRP